MPDRAVRFTDSFFDRPDSLFADERGDDGSASATDFLLYDVPRIRDRLAADYVGNTLATDDPDVRVYISSGILVATVAIYAVSWTTSSRSSGSRFRRSDQQMTSCRSSPGFETVTSPGRHGADVLHDAAEEPTTPLWYS